MAGTGDLDPDGIWGTKGDRRTKPQQHLSQMRERSLNLDTKQWLYRQALDAGSGVRQHLPRTYSQLMCC
jgi:hypothetical protein